MAKRGSGRTGLFIFLGLVAVAAVGGGLWLAGDVDRAKTEAAAAAKIVPTLPAGRLQLLQSGMVESRFLALDETRKGSNGADVMVLRVGHKAAGLDGGASLMSQRETIDCASQRIFDGQVGAFDTDGKLKSAAAGYAGKRGRPVESGDLETPVVCGGKAGRVVADWRAAQRETQQLPDGYAEIAEAHPKDFHGWAWLCAAAARGAWRNEAPDDCRRALALRPDAAATRLDRAFLFIKIGRRPEADADFRTVMAAEPKNATAIFGHSLILVLAHDEAGGRTVRGQALDIDEDVPNWVAQTYQLQMSREYRVR